MRGMRIGVDLVHLERFARIFAGRKAARLARIFAPEELWTCTGRSRPLAGLAARFAAKEAFLKAVEAAPGDRVRLADVRVALTGSGAPRLVVRASAARVLRRRGCRASALSLAHHGEYAVACLVVW